MKRQGTLVRWDPDRGFGFIRCAEIPADVFVHQRDFSDRGTAPQVGMRLSFDEIHVGGKGPRAVAVQPAGAMPQQPPARPRRGSAPPRLSSDRPNDRGRETARPSPRWPMVLLLAAYCALLGLGVWAGRLPPIALGVLLLLDLLTFFVYGFDKNAAETGRWRTSESTLHLLSLAGGWPGAWCAQQLFRHKVRKTRFMAGYWTTVLANLAALGAWTGKLLPAGLLAF